MERPFPTGLISSSAQNHAGDANKIKTPFFKGTHLIRSVEAFEKDFVYLHERQLLIKIRAAQVKATGFADDLAAQSVQKR